MCNLGFDIFVFQLYVHLVYTLSGQNPLSNTNIGDTHYAGVRVSRAAFFPVKFISAIYQN